MDKRLAVPHGRHLSVSVVLATMLVVCALLSATLLSSVFSSSKTYQGAYEQLDAKRDNVLLLTASAAGISAALTFLPDDTCTPIAEELTEISKGFAIVIGALLLEKYLLTTLGFVFFTMVVPACCVMCAVSLFMEPTSLTRNSLRHTSLKLFIFGLILFISIPASVFLASKVDETYEVSIQEAAGTSREVTDAVEQDMNSSKPEEAANLLDFLGQQMSNIQTAAKDAIKSVTGAVDWAKSEMSKYVELFAVMMVTSIVIPILVPLVMYLAFKVLVGQQQIVVSQVVPQLPSPHEHNGR